MSTRIATLHRIRDQLAREGLSSALSLARAAYESGQIDKRDVPEVFMAIKSGSWLFIDQLGVRIDAKDKLLSTPTG